MRGRFTIQLHGQFWTDTIVISRKNVLLSVKCQKTGPGASDDGPDGV